MKDLPEQPGAPAFILDHEDSANDDTRHLTIYMRIKILTEAGRKHGDIQIPYSAEDFTISDLDGRTIHTHGNVIEFEQSGVGRDNPALFTRV